MRAGLENDLDPVHAASDADVASPIAASALAEGQTLDDPPAGRGSDRGCVSAAGLDGWNRDLIVGDECGGLTSRRTAPIV